MSGYSKVQPRTETYKNLHTQKKIIFCLKKFLAKAYRNVPKRTEMYQNMQKHTQAYKNVRKCTVIYVNIRCSKENYKNLEIYWKIFVISRVFVE